MRIWSLATGECRHVFDFDNQNIEQVRIFPSRVVACGERGLFCIWDPSSGEQKFEGTHDAIRPKPLFLDPDRVFVGLKGSLLVRDMHSGKVLRRFALHNTDSEVAKIMVAGRFWMALGVRYRPKEERQRTLDVWEYPALNSSKREVHFEPAGIEDMEEQILYPRLYSHSREDTSCVV